MRCPRCGYDVPNIVAIESGRRGGHARNDKASRERLSAIGKAGAAKRWAGHVKKEKPRK